MADRTFAKFTLLQDRSSLAPSGRRAARRRQAGVPRRLRGLRRRPLAARLLNHRNARRRRPGAAQPEPEPRRHPHLPRRPRPERAGEMGDDALLVPLDDQTLALLRGGGAAGDLHLRAQVPLPLPDGQAAPLVRAAAGGARPDHEKPHRGRPPLPRDHDQHDLLLRDRRPGVRRLLRGRRPGRVPRPRQRAAPDRVERVHRARDADLHLRGDVGRARRSTRSTAPPAPSAPSAPALG